MNSKSILKRILPILIALLVILIVVVIASVATKDKRVPSFKDKSYGKESFITYTTADGNEIKLSRNAVYEALRGTSSDQSVITSTTVNEIINMIDEDLLKDYIANVAEQDVYDLISKQIFSSTFDDYIKNNKDAFKVEAHKEGKSYHAYLNEKIDSAIKDYVETLKYSYGITSTAADYSYKDGVGEYYYVQENGADKLDDNGEKVYQLRVDTNSAIYKYYVIDAARTDYAKTQIKTDYEADFAKYLEYLANLEAYNKYKEALADYNEALEDWKNTKQGSKPKKSDYFDKEVKQPEEVSQPLNGALDSDAFKKLYEEDNYKKFWAVIVGYDTQTEAESALLQYGVVIAENASGNNRWFHYGVTDFAGASAEQKAVIAGYDFSTKGDTTIITDDDYYNLLTTSEEEYNKDAAKTSTEKVGLVLATKDNPDPRTGAYELTEAEIKELIVKLYNQKYQYDPTKQLTAADYDPAAEFEGTEDSKLFYKESTLTSLGLYSKGTSSNKFNKFSSDSKFEDADTYTNTIISASSKYYIYLILDKDATATDWEDYVGEAKYYETEFYTAHKEELLLKQATISYTKKALAKLRNDKGLIIYDSVLEANYMENYESDYKATKKSSKTLVASYENDGKKEITVDALWERLAPFYGVYSTVDQLQYEWVFLEAKDNEGNLFNQYVDYNKYLKGKKLSKCLYNNDKAKKLYENVSTYVDNVKYYFSIGYYESYGYPSSYGWKNFITDYYATFYNVRLTTNDDLKLFFINQQIISEYSNYISKVTDDNWEKAYLTYAGKTLSEFINTTGVHLLIAIPDVMKNEENNSSSNFVDPTNWTDAQVAAAEELYDAVLALLAQVKESEISSVLKAIASAFDDAPLPLVDGTKPNIAYTSETIDGTEINNNYFSYEYKYYPEGATAPTATIDVAKYKALGFRLTCEDLTVTQGTMVSEFEDAVRQIWNSQLDSLLENQIVDKAVVYDHTFRAPAYKNYNDDTDTEGVVNDNAGTTYLTTTFGMHVYVNLTSDLSAYFTTNKDNDKVFIAIPDIKYVKMYVYDKNESVEEDYISLATLLSSYKTAKDDNDTKRLETVKANIEKAKEKLGFDMSFDEFYELLDNYAGDDSSLVSTQLSTWFTTYTAATQSSNASYSMAFADYTSSSYYHLCYMQDLLAKMEAGKVTFTDGDAYAQSFKDYATYFEDSYYKSFQAINFLNGNKDGVKELLEALSCINGVDAYNEVAGSAINALKAFASSAYNNLNAEDKAELQDLAEEAGLIA